MRDPVRQARRAQDPLRQQDGFDPTGVIEQEQGQRPGRMKVVGGEANNPHLQSVLNAVLPIPAEVGLPLCSVDQTNMRPADRKGPMSEWAVAFGLGLKLAKGPFAPKDGTPRDPNATNIDVTPSGAQVLDPDDLIRSVAGGPVPGGPAPAPAAVPAKEAVHA